HSSSRGPDVAKVGTSSAESSVVTRAAAQASLPPAFSHLRLNGSAATSLNDGVTARPAITAPPRRIGPSPRRFNPIFFGGFAPFGFGYGFGFTSFGYGYGPFGYGPFGYNYLGYNNFGYNNFGYN